MPLVDTLIRASSHKQLQAALNAYLATLVNPMVESFSVQADDLASRPGIEYSAMLTVNVAAGPALATPFLVDVLEDTTLPGLQQQLADYRLATSGQFTAQPRYLQTSDENITISRWSATIMRNADPGASRNFSADGAVTGVAGGDLYGTYPNPLVRGFNGIPLQVAAPVSGQYWIFNALTGSYQLSQVYRYFVSGAAAVAAAPFINGTYVVISPGSPTSEGGTYQVVSNGGASFPADYTKLSDNTDTASEVSIVDAGGYYAGTNVEAALQEIGAGQVSGPGGVLAIGLNVMDSVSTAACSAGDWEILLQNGPLRYKTTLSVAHDGALASAAEGLSVAGPGVGVLPITFDADVFAGNVRILANATATGWSYRLRRLALLVI